VHGVSGRIMYTLLTLVRQYLSVERGFTGAGMEACIQSLRKTHAGDLPYVYEMCRSHLAITAKNKLLLILLEHVSKVAAHVSKRSDEANNTDQQGKNCYFAFFLVTVTQSQQCYMHMLLIHNSMLA
jgi:Acetyl-CoA carboxylase, central region